MLEAQINQAFLDAYKAKNDAEVSTLRMLKSALLNKKIEKRMVKEDLLADDDVMTLLKSEAKKRQDSAVAYREGAREDLAAGEESEIAIIKKFLPEQMSDEQVSALIDEVLAGEQNVSPSAFGQLIGKVMAAARGAADGGTVSRLLKEKIK